MSSVDQTNATEPKFDRESSGPRVLNVPNQITIARLVLSVASFVFLACDYYLTALVLFVLAAGDRLGRRLLGAEVWADHEAGPGTRSVRR